MAFLALGFYMKNLFYFFEEANDDVEFFVLVAFKAGAVLRKVTSSPETGIKYSTIAELRSTKTKYFL